MSKLVILEPAQLFWKEDGFPYIWGLIPLRNKPTVVFNGGELLPLILDFNKNGKTYRLLMDPFCSKWSLDDYLGKMVFIWEAIRGRKPEFKTYDYFLTKLYARWPELEETVKYKDTEESADFHVLMFKNWFDFIELTQAVHKEQVTIRMNADCKKRMAEMSQQLVLRMLNHARDGEQVFVGGLSIAIHSLTVSDLTHEPDGRLTVFGDPIKIVRPLFCTSMMHDWCPATWIIETEHGHSMGLITMTEKDRSVVRNYLSHSPKDYDFNDLRGWAYAGTQIIKTVAFFEKNVPYQYEKHVGGTKHMPLIDKWYTQVVKTYQHAITVEAGKLASSF